MAGPRLQASGHSEGIGDKSIGGGGVDPGVGIELEQLLQQAFFDQHLESDGITLEDGEVSLKLVGRLVGAGFTLLSRV